MVSIVGTCDTIKELTSDNVINITSHPQVCHHGVTMEKGKYILHGVTISKHPELQELHVADL